MPKLYEFHKGTAAPAAPLWNSYIAAIWVLSLSNGVVATLVSWPVRRPQPEVGPGNMPQIAEHHDLGGLSERLRKAGEVDASLMAEILDVACRRFTSLGRSEKTARVEQLIQSSAWTDAALVLIDLELPLWQIRRLAYDEGEWHCALSRERELPDWLDRSIEAQHADLALAILSAFVEAQRISEPESRTSVPTVSQRTRDFYEAIPIDNFL
jgi:hypothetical protein